MFVIQFESMRYDAMRLRESVLKKYITLGDTVDGEMFINKINKPSSNQDFSIHELNSTLELS